jgi:hypothetical protein
MIWICEFKEYHYDGDYIWRIDHITDDETKARNWYNQDPNERDISSWEIE